ncbi:MAG: FlgO family outer membrane protein [Pseudomonadota bacterium]|uniref:FlgO family outer membrane protein n=1 Tax=Rheinheimera fenheensis TaxID=3152295 RepID=UPI00325DB3D0
MKAMLWLLTLWLLSACTHQVRPVVQQAPTALSTYSLHHYTQQLSEQLFKQLEAQRYSADGVAVASFLPVNSLSLTHTDSTERQLANQLAENMLVHARQHGLTVYDYRLRNSLLLAAEHEQALSRQLDAIDPASDADTLLTGTYTQMDDGVLVNVRLIRLQNKQVLAAASGYVPANVLWPEQQVDKRGNTLYRRSASGEIE